jgi:single-strand DNA-binding protein
LNKVILIGRLSRDPELKFTTGAGIAVASFTLAVNRKIAGQDGKKQADFIQVICWRKLAEIVANNLGKGRKVLVSGNIQTRNYQAQDGHKVYITEVVADEVEFLDYPKDSGTSSADPANGNDFFPVEDDDIPF